jgi:Zn-dependent peptidase ImmA (M78 family)
MNAPRKFKNHIALLTEFVEKGNEVVAPVDLDAIVQMLGIEVKDDPALEVKDVIGEISFHNECGHAVIKINPFQNTYRVRRRFTLAHEIAHYCLHSSLDKQVFSDDKKTMNRMASYWDKYESEANSFAAQLLMPKPLIFSEGKKLLTSRDMTKEEFTEEIAAIFGVSKQAMSYRLKNLGIL